MAQIRDFGATGCTKIFSEQVQSVAERHQLKANGVRKGRDTLVVTKLARPRSTAHLLSLVDQLERGCVALRILDFGGGEVDTKTPSGRMLLTLFAAIAKFERSNMLVQQREGIAAAKITK